MRQTLAIFLDSYRELNSRKMFWIVLLLSFLVVAMFGCVGIDSRGFTFLHWSLDFGISTAFMSEGMFYKHMLFVNLGVKFWLGIIATILALVSTASVFPDMVSGGAIELVLSKPISRVRLFITKYCAAMLFVTLQVAVFSVGSFLVIGFRGGMWEPRILLAIPIVVVFFSYLFCVCTLLGLITRSSIASLLLTVLIWFLVFVLSASETGLSMWNAISDQRVTLIREDISRREAELTRLENADLSPGLAKVGNSMLITGKKSTLESRQTRLKDAESSQRKIGWISFAMLCVKTALPKVTDTKDLIERAVLSEDEREGLIRDASRDAPQLEIPEDGEEIRVDMRKVQRQAFERKYSTSIWWILGTSAAFEVVILAIAGWIFVRRDF